MLLAPQHFQQQSVRDVMHTAYHAQHASPYHWGVVAMEIATGRLSAGKLYVSALEAILPDGLVVRHDPSHGELMVDLTPHASELQERPETIYLGVVKFIDGQPIVGDRARFVGYEAENIADLNSGEGEMVIPRLRPQLVLHVGEPPENYVAMPIARVAVRNEAFTLTQYVAPSLRLDEASPLGNAISEMLRRLRQKAQVLDDRQHQLERAEDFEGASRARRQIELLTGQLPPVEALLRSSACHPFNLYVSLCSLLGPIAALVPGQVPPELPAYNHNDIWTTYQNVLQSLDAMLSRGTQENYDEHRFVWDGQAFRIRFRPEWVHSPLVVSAQRKRGVTEQQLARWMDDALIGSESRLDLMRNRRVLGLEREWIDQFGDVVPTRDTLLFQVRAEPQYLAIGEDLVIMSRDKDRSKDGDDPNRPSQLVLYVVKGQ